MGSMNMIYIMKERIKMKVIIGAGSTKYNGWKATQEDELDVLRLESFEAMFKEDSIDAMLAEHVWEHMTVEEGKIAAENCYKFLKAGGYIRCAVPDINFNNEWYQNMVQIGGPGPEDHPAYGHKVVYDYKTFVKVFELAGFKVSLLEYCDENHVFHYKYWNADDGKIGRSLRYDTRNSVEELGMVSLIIDAHKEGTIKP